MKSLKREFEENYKPVYQLAPGRKRLDTMYVYYAPWYVWDVEEKRFRHSKRMIVALWTMNTMIFLMAATRNTSANWFLPVVIPALFSLCAYIFAVFGIFQFALSKRKTTSMNFKIIHRRLFAATRIYSIGMTAAAAGVFSLRLKEPMQAASWIVLGGYLACAACSWAIYHIYSHIPVITEKNKEGETKNGY